MIRPPRLRPGARIALVAAAGPLPEGAVDRALERITGWGWEPVLGRSARLRTGYLAGSDADRAADLDAAIRSADNDAIWFLRGGYGTMRILDRIDWSPLRERPRPVIGFSDNTAVHLALGELGLVSFHGPHPGAADLSPYAVEGLRRMLTDASPLGPLPFPEGPAQRADTLVGGVAEGVLMGGNLSLLAAMAGTRHALRAEGALLILEEVAEPAYRIDRLLSQLRLSGALEGVRGVAIGAFSDCPDLPDAGLPSPAEVLHDRLEDLGVPVAMGFPFGHVPDNWTLPLGTRARLDADRGALVLLEPAVEE